MTELDPLAIGEVYTVEGFRWRELDVRLFLPELLNTC